MWALVSKVDGSRYPIRFQNDGIPYGGDYLADKTLATLQKSFPSGEWEKKLEDK